MTLTSHHSNRTGALEDHPLEHLNPFVQLPSPFGTLFRTNKQGNFVPALFQSDQVSFVLVCNFCNAFHDIHRLSGKRKSRRRTLLTGMLRSRLGSRRTLAHAVEIDDGLTFALFAPQREAP